MKPNIRGADKQRVLSVALFITLTLSFQNCAQVKFLSSTFESTTKMENGGVYGGKLVGTYYRFVPGFNCEQKEAPSAVLEISETSAELTENKTLLCNASKQSLDLSLIDASIYQNEIAGYLDGIFEGQSKAPTAIPSNLVEVWCKDRNDEQGIETITHYDRVLNLAVNRIYYSSQTPAGGLAPHEISDFPVARVLAQNTLVVKDDQGFELTLHRDQPAAQIGLYKAEMKAVIAGENIYRDTSCRLGGSLDSSIWPSQQVVDVNVQGFKFSPDKSSIAFSSNTITGNANLYFANPSGASLKQISPNLLSPGIQDFFFTPDSKSVVYRGSQRLSGVPEIYKVNFDGTGNLHLGDDLVDDHQIDPQGRLTDIMFTGTGALIYKDGAGNEKAVSSLNLNIVPLSGGTPLKLNAPFTDTFGVYGYNFSPQLGKVVYIEGMPTTPDIYSVDLDGSNHRKITPSITSSTSLLWYDQLALSKGGRYVVLNAIERTSTLHGKNIVVALDGSSTTVIPDTWNWSFSNEADTFALLLSQSYQDSAGLFRVYDPGSRLMNLKTGSLIALPNLQNAFFTGDSRNLVGAEVRSDGQLQSLILSTVTGQRAELCPDVSGTLMNILEIEPNKFAIVRFSAQSRILDVYLKESGACRKANSVVVTRDKIDFIRNVSIAPDRQKLLVQMEISQFSNTFRLPGKGAQLFYVPLNGRPGVLVNSPVTAGAAISEASFLNDSRSVLYVGDQIKPGEKNVFVWKDSAN